jgi:hypothetical protein
MWLVYTRPTSASDFLGEFTKLLLQTISFFIVKLAYLLIFDTFRVIKNRFNHLFEHNLKLKTKKLFYLDGIRSFHRNATKPT